MYIVNIFNYSVTNIFHQVKHSEILCSECQSILSSTLKLPYLEKSLCHFSWKNIGSLKTDY